MLQKVLPCPVAEQAFCKSVETKLLGKLGSLGKNIKKLHYNGHLGKEIIASSLG